MIAAKSLSGMSAANDTYDVVSNDGAADRLWLFSSGEMTNAVYPSVGFSSSYYDADAKRSSKRGWWLRSPNDQTIVRSVNIDGYLRWEVVVGYYAVAPGFTLSAPDGSSNDLICDVG